MEVEDPCGSCGHARSVHCDKAVVENDEYSPNYGVRYYCRQPYYSHGGSCGCMGFKPKTKTEEKS